MAEIRVKFSAGGYFAAAYWRGRLLAWTAGPAVDRDTAVRAIRQHLRNH